MAVLECLVPCYALSAYTLGERLRITLIEAKGNERKKRKVARALGRREGKVFILKAEQVVRSC